uniref:Uncharacterized protein n=1 Tax=Pipistrellus kuhlii TaxID=59472 RepID=A0A7J7WD39_PIPKU|nr:hypothetical protein mPipKuh1_008030 [Pipistrellus kuhlii]
MRMWCVSLTMHGASKLVIHDFICPVAVLESGKSLRHPHISVRWATCSPPPHTHPAPPPVAGAWPSLRLLLVFPYTQVFMKKLGLIHVSRSKCCANSVSLDLLKRKCHFSIFQKNKNKGLQHGFQSIFSIQHENIDE